MNRLFAIIITLVVFIASPACAAMHQKTADPNRQTMWNNLTDSWHTLGQSPQQARFTKMKLRAQRTRTRLINLNRSRNRSGHKTWFVHKPGPNHSWMTPGN